MTSDGLSFTVHGIWRGRPVTIRWRDGHVDGPAGLAEEIVLRARKVSGYDGDGLVHPIDAVMLIREELDSIDDFEGMPVGEPRRRRLGAEERAVMQLSRRAISA